MTEESKIRELAEKWLNGTITNEERQEFEQWYDLDAPESMEWKGAKSETELQQRILQAVKGNRTTQNRLRIIMVMRSAAALLLLAAGFGAYYYLNNPLSVQSSANIIAPEETLAPGRDGAVLTLADGSKIVLDSLGDGKIATQNGTQVILNKGQLAYDANNAQDVSYNTMTTPKGRQFKIVLPDGSRVWLNAASSIRYPTSFVGTNRKVEVTGEVFMEVVEDTKRPFLVSINNTAAVQVLGTSFNINSYGDETPIRTTLLEGSVNVVNGNERALLKVAQQADIKSNGAISIADNVDVESVVAWKNGMFQFNNTSLEVILKQASRWYDIQFEYSGDVHQSFSGQISRNTNAEDFLSVLKSTDKINFEIKGRTILVKPS